MAFGFAKLGCLKHNCLIIIRTCIPGTCWDQCFKILINELWQETDGKLSVKNIPDL